MITPFFLAAAASLLQFGDVQVGFSIETGDATNNVTVTAKEMRSLVVKTNGTDVTAVWCGHPLCGDRFSVSAKFSLLPQGGFEYSGFSYSGKETPSTVRSIAFPEIHAPYTGKTKIFRPRYTGEVVHPRWEKMKPGEKVFNTGAISKAFNCMALIEPDGTSHFLDLRGEARLHGVSFEAEIGSETCTLVFGSVYHPPFSKRLQEAGSIPFPGVCAPYRGGWYEASMMHRSWIEKQSWFKTSTMRDFSRLRDIALWMWSRGGITVSEPPIHWFMKETGLKAGLDWYWWHNVPYDTAYPFFWPPRDGVKEFTASVKRMKDAGAFVQVYINGTLWDEVDPRWSEGGADCVILEESGKTRGRTFNPFTNQRQTQMCGEAPEFQRIIRDLGKNLAASGLDGIYMDMISCNAHIPCFNPRHAHEPGDRNAMTLGYRRYVDDVRTDNPGLLLSSEATSETHLDKFEFFIVHYSSWERFRFGVMPRSEPVPAVTVIFRDACVMFGSFATPCGIPGWDPLWGKCEDTPDTEAIVAKYPDQFAVEFARGVIWGIQPMIHNFTMKDVSNPRIAKDIQFIKDTARFYFDHRDFLFDGKLQKPAELNCATRRMDFLQASSYRRPCKSKVCVQPALPAVFHSEWVAPDGRKASVLVNWTREKQPYELNFEGFRRTGVLPALSWRLESF